VAIEGGTPYKNASKQERQVTSLPLTPFYTNTSLVRANARGLTGTSDSASRRPTSDNIASVMGNGLVNDTTPPPGSPLRVHIAISSVTSTNQRETSVPVAADRREARSPRRRSTSSQVLSPTRQCTSPDGVRCEGCCEYDSSPRATVVSAILAWRLADDINDTFTSPTGPRYLYQHAPIRSVLGKVHGVRSLPCYAASSVSASSSNMALR